MASKMYEFLLATSGPAAGTFELEDAVLGLKNVKAALFDLVSRATDSGHVVLVSQYREAGTDEWVEWPALGRGQQMAALNNRPPDVEDEDKGQRRRAERARELRETISMALTELAELAMPEPGTPDDGIAWEWRNIEAGSTNLQRRRIDGSFGERCARSAMLLASLAEFSIAHPDEPAGIKGFYPMPR